MTRLAFQYDDPGAGFAAFIGVFLLIYLGIAVVSVIAMVKILNKAGYSGWWSLTMFVPLVNVVMFLVFAFADWPVLQRLRWAEQQQRGYQPGYPPQGYPQQGYPQQGYHPQQ